MIAKTEQIEFYKEELEELELDVKSTFESSSISLFNTGKIYIGQYRGQDKKRGNVFFDIPNGQKYHSPRIDKLMNCFKLKDDKVLPRQWGSTSYRNLLKPLNSVLDMSETKLVNYTQSNRQGWITMILNGLDMRFLESLKFNDLLGFGPTIPPYEYLQNLKLFSQSISPDDNLWNKLLNFDYQYINDKNPKLLTEEIDIADYVINKVNRDKIFIFQGPPGTGKTHQIADVVSRLANDDKSVLITALTNKAAVEACEKPFLEELMTEGRISKTSLQSSEKNKFPNLLYADKIIPIKGKVVLSTYYQFSKTWDKYNQDFDYVIVEEASQAFLTTIAAATKVGKHVIVVGDPLQIQPIVKYKNYKKISMDIEKLVYGLQTICDLDGIPFYRKIETRRLTPRATDYTNLFYQNTVISKSLFTNLNDDKGRLSFLDKFIHKQGGPTLILENFKVGKNVNESIPFLVRAIDEILDNKLGSVAVLTPFIDTLINLQKTLKIKTNSNDYLIDSVDRVQGLDVDFCFYVIPDYNYRFSFNLNRFNVATSRSKKATFIIAPKEFYRKTSLRGESGSYLIKLLEDNCFMKNKGDYSREKIELSSKKIKNNENKTIEINDITEVLSEKGLIDIDGFYNSLIINDKVYAEAEFIFTSGNTSVAVDPFSIEDEDFLKKKGYDVISLKELKERFNL